MQTRSGAALELVRFNPVYPHEQVVRWIFRHGPRGPASGMRVLDIGCDTGRHAIFLSNEGFDVYACDPSAAGLRELQAAAAIRGLNVRSHQSSARDLSHYANDAFDFVLSFNAAYSTTDTESAQAFREIHRVLKPAGRCLCVLRGDADSSDDVERAFALFTDTYIERMSDLHESVADGHWIVDAAKPGNGGRTGDS